MWHWRSRLPEGSLNRTRLGALFFAGLAISSQLGQVGNPERSPAYLRLATACIVLTFVILLCAFRRRRTSWWTALPVPVMVAIGGAGLKDPVASVALAIASTIVLSLYGSTRLWVARVIGALITVPVAVTISPVSDNRSMAWNSPTVIGVLPQVVLMAVLTRGIYVALLQQERSVMRESLLARAGHAMLGVTDVDRIHEVGVRAAEELVALNSDTTFLVLARRAGGLVAVGLAGAPEEVRGRHFSDGIIADTAELTALMPEFREWHVGPIGDDPATAQRFVAIGGRRRVPDDVVDAFRTLSHQVALAESNCMAHAELEHRADHDQLTGLPTRAKFLRAVGEALNGESGSGVTALLNIDLDDFKQVNDGYGHATGDELLMQVAARLSAVADGRGMAARFGGDEFALLLTGLPDATEADRIAALLCTQLSAPIRLSTTTVTVGASIGIAVAEPGITPTDLTRRADVAMYSAKTTGKNRTGCYRPTGPADITLIGRHAAPATRQPAV